MIVAIAALAGLGAATAHAQDFVDVIDDVGLSGYRAQAGDGHGPGGVFTDLDGDGYPDLYLPRSWGNPNELWLNVPGVGGGRDFARVPGDGGAGNTGNVTGMIAGDYDNDGDLDLYVINFDQPNALLKSMLVETGSLTYVDVTAATDPTPGVSDDQHGLGSAFHNGIALDNSLTAVWGDPDRDGDLDLFVGNHNGFFGAEFIEGPSPLPGRRDVFYRNEGDGTFTDVTTLYDVTGYVTAIGLYETSNQRYSSTNAAIFADFNNDAWPDLLVTNKVGGPDDRDMLYMNLGAVGGVWQGFDMVTYGLVPTFGHRSGAAMGVDVGDPDNDGDLDVYITDWSNFDNPAPEGRNDLWGNLLVEGGGNSFVWIDGLPAEYSWGTVWQDLDNNGLQDLYVGGQAPRRDYLYMNFGATMVESAATAGVDQDRNSRGVLSADYNRDGWPDVFVLINSNWPSVLYENRFSLTHPSRGFLSLQLTGDPTGPGPLLSSRDAIGARVHLAADLDGDGAVEPGEVQLREVVSGLSNAASTSSLELEFGFGSADEGTVQILWPSGRETVFTTSVDQFKSVDEALLLEGDVNCDGRVDVDDLVAVVLGWGPCPAFPGFCASDPDRDGDADIDDIVTVVVNWTP